MNQKYLSSTGLLLKKLADDSNSSNAACKPSMPSQHQQQPQMQQQPSQVFNNPNLKIVPEVINSLPRQVPSIQECRTCVAPSTDNMGYQTYTYKTKPQYSRVGSRAENDVIKNEMTYTDYNTIPVYVDSKSYEYGYSFIPPERWYPVPPAPPVCVSEKRCPVCPVATTGTNLELKEWYDSTRISPGDMINTRYVEEKLNSGR